MSVASGRRRRCRCRPSPNSIHSSLGFVGSSCGRSIGILMFGQSRRQFFFRVAQNHIGSVLLHTCSCQEMCRLGTQGKRSWQVCQLWHVGFGFQQTNARSRRSHQQEIFFFIGLGRWFRHKGPSVPLRGWQRPIRFVMRLWCIVFYIR